MSVVRCGNCDGWIDDARFSPIKLVKLDEAGAPVLNRAGERTFVYIQLPLHVFPPSRFRPDALIRVACDHGLPVHPNPETEAEVAITRLGRSWVRSRYVTVDGKCPVCRNEEPPADWLTPADAA